MSPLGRQKPFAGIRFRHVLVLKLAMPAACVTCQRWPTSGRDLPFSAQKCAFLTGLAIHGVHALRVHPFARLHVRFTIASALWTIWCQRAAMLTQDGSFTYVEGKMLRARVWALYGRAMKKRCFSMYRRNKQRFPQEGHRSTITGSGRMKQAGESRRVYLLTCLELVVIILAPKFFTFVNSRG